MKFSELSIRAKCRATADYVTGWYQTHEDEDFFGDDAYNLLMEDEDEFLGDGELLDSKDEWRMGE